MTSRPYPAAAPQQEPSRIPTEGWHCSHMYYQWDRAALAKIKEQGLLPQLVEQFQHALQPQGEKTPQRLQTGVVSGHKADFSFIALDPDPLTLDAIHQSLLVYPLGVALRATYSFTSLTEVSEYVPTVEQYARRLIHEGEQEGSDAYQAKVNAYRSREPMMREQRLTPSLPDWPATCFYPMNKKRKVGENWFLLPFSERNRLMAEHARSGMAFAGKVSQLITVGVGLEDWEWGVTLWARNPEFLKDIVYRMRFDEASARYAEFGPFYTTYLADADHILQHCGIDA